MRGGGNNSGATVEGKGIHIEVVTRESNAR
jgi:hypothetical protein